MSENQGRDLRDAESDPALGRMWQQASDETPPPELDAEIIAAARRSVQDRDARAGAPHDTSGSRHWLTRWQPLAAAATVAGLAFVLAQLLPRDRDAERPNRTQESAPGPATAIPRASDRATGAPAAMGRTNALANESAGADRPTTAVPKATDSGKPAAVAEPKLEERQRSETPMSAADWAAEIAKLHESGDLAGAADSLRAFRSADPDADNYLPESLREWARTVE